MCFGAGSPPEVSQVEVESDESLDLRAQPRSKVAPRYPENAGATARSAMSLREIRLVHPGRVNQRRRWPRSEVVVKASSDQSDDTNQDRKRVSPGVFEALATVDRRDARCGEGSACVVHEGAMPSPHGDGEHDRARVGLVTTMFTAPCATLTAPEPIELEADALVKW